MRDIELIIDSIKQIQPSVAIHQLKVSHPGTDDDGVWFFREPGCPYEVQIESTGGMCPFLIETDETDERFTAATVDEVVGEISSLLHLDSSH
jgi:hypothetical protein